MEKSASGYIDKQTDVVKIDGESEFSLEILNVIDRFQGELGSLVTRRYGLLPGALDKVQSLLHRYNNLNPFKSETRDICDSLKAPLTQLVEVGSYIDAEPNRFYQCIEVEVSHSPKSLPKEIKEGAAVVAQIRPGRGERDDLLVISNSRIMMKNVDFEVDCSNSDGDPNKLQKGTMFLLSNEPKYGIPFGKMMIVGETQVGHRNHVRVVCTENWDSPENIKQELLSVIDSGNLGADVYYDESGRLTSMGIYFKENGQKVFGIYHPGENPIYKNVSGVTTRGEVRPANEPSITQGDGFIIIERNGVKYKLDSKIDINKILKKVIDTLYEQNNIINI